MVKFWLDGISFKSSISYDDSGYNLVIFEPQKAKYNKGSGLLKKIEKVKFEYVDEKFDSKINYESGDYIMFKQGKWQT